MRYLRPFSALFLSAMLAGVAWSDEADKKDSAQKQGEKEKAADTDKGERPERPSFEEMRKKMLEKFDADKDGKLNDEERAKAREYRHEHASEFTRERGDGERPRGPRPPRGPEGRARDGHGPDGHGPEGGPDGRRPDGPPPAMRLFDRFDEDGDGQLSRKEFERLVTRMREFGPPPGPGGPGHPGGSREWRRPGPSDGPGADRRPPRAREDGERGPERRRPRPPRDDDDRDHGRADRPRHLDGDDHGKASESEEKEEKSADKSTT
jgi:hypothetical protein